MKNLTTLNVNLGILLWLLFSVNACGLSFFVGAQNDYYQEKADRFGNFDVNESGHALVTPSLVDVP